jgi:hypothetical protein
VQIGYIFLYMRKCAENSIDLNARLLKISHNLTRPHMHLGEVFPIDKSHTISHNLTYKVGRLKWIG